MTARNYFYAVTPIKILHRVLHKVSLEPNIVKQHEISEYSNESQIVFVFLYICIYDMFYFSELSFTAEIVHNFERLFTYWKTIILHF